ncbi:MAG TPA: glucan biosynthesis protein, partial [Rudaea sp.]
MPTSPLPASDRSATRRTLFLCAGVFLAACALPQYARAFGLKDVDARAKALADKPYVDTGANLPGPLLHLSQEKYHAIAYRPNFAYWSTAKLPWTLEFFHEGWRFDRPVKINEIAGPAIREIKFDPQWFDYGNSGVDPAVAKDLGFAGFHVNYPLNTPSKKDEVLSFLGASYFRALGKQQTYGLSARGLAIDTAQSTGEEFPRFVEFWIEKPQVANKPLVAYALLDSPRITGAYRFALTPGEDTVVEVTATLHPRDKIDKLGIAPLTSMFFFGSNQHAASEDFRP